MFCYLWDIPNAYITVPDSQQGFNKNLANEWKLYTHSMIFDHVKQTYL